MSVLCQSMSQVPPFWRPRCFFVAGDGAGILRYATIGEPPSLDVQMGTATIAGTIGNHMFETLYAFDSQYKPQPLLATGEKIEDGGKKLVIGLRQGVKFHNGQEMTPTTWSRRSSAGASSARAANF